jgi:hypothetical protein
VLLLVTEPQLSEAVGAVHVTCNYDVNDAADNTESCGLVMPAGLR